MPPAPHSGLGWRLFFGLLMVLQVIGIGVMWRTYDAIGTNDKAVLIINYRLDAEVKPTLQRHGEAIEKLQDRLRP